MMDFDEKFESMSDVELSESEDELPVLRTFRRSLYSLPSSTKNATMAGAESVAYKVSEEDIRRARQREEQRQREEDRERPIEERRRREEQRRSKHEKRQPPDKCCDPYSISDSTPQRGCTTALVVENKNKKPYKYQRMNSVVICILMTEAAERFAYFGFRAVLVLYFTTELEFADNVAISLFAYATFLANFSPLFGAMLADSFFGRFNTILSFGSLYLLGLIILTHAAFLSSSLDLQSKRITTMVGLLLVCVGSGGIKPCVSIFGADQVCGEKQWDENQTRVVSKEKDVESQRSLAKEDANASSSTIKTVVTTASDDDHSEDKRQATKARNRDTDDDRVRTFFSYFSICINFGAVASFLVIPTVKARFGFGVAFLIPTLLMGVAVIVFLSKQNQYVYRSNNPTGASLFTTFRLCLWLLHNNLFSYPIVAKYFSCLRPGPVPLARALPTRDGSEDDYCDDASDVSSLASTRSHTRDKQLCWEDETDAPAIVSDAESMTPSMTGSTYSGQLTTTESDRVMAQQLSDAARALNVLPILAMLPVFWMLYDQQGSVWTLQATRMALHGLQPEQINLLNPAAVTVLIPIFDAKIYPYLEKRGLDISPLRRMGWGMILASFSFFISGILEYMIEYRRANLMTPICVLWQIPQVLCMAISEIFVSVTGLEFAYSVSPDRLKSFIMAAYLLTIAKGDFMFGVFYSTIFRDFNRALTLHIFSLMMLFNLASYGYVVRLWELRHGLVSWDLFDKVLEITAISQ